MERLRFWILDLFNPIGPPVFLVTIITALAVVNAFILFLK
jgi:hypothetical protein